MSRAVEPPIQFARQNFTAGELEALLAAYELVSPDPDTVQAKLRQYIGTAKKMLEIQQTKTI